MLTYNYTGNIFGEDFHLCLQHWNKKLVQEQKAMHLCNINCLLVLYFASIIGSISAFLPILMHLFGQSEYVHEYV